MGEQANFISEEDDRAAARRWVKQAAYDIGIEELAHRHELDPSTLRNQLCWRDGGRWKPSADVLIDVFLLHAELRKRLVGLRGEVLSRPPDLSPEEALREALAMAKAGEFGNAGLRAMSDLYARVRK